MTKYTHRFEVTYTSPLSANVHLIIPNEDLYKIDYEVSVMGETLSRVWGYAWGDHARMRTREVTAQTPEELSRTQRDTPHD